MAEVRIRFPAREYQKPVIEWFRNGGKRACEVWHRRAGKDRTATFIESELACKRVGLYWHALPEYAQARRVIWDAITKDGQKLIDISFPPAIVKKKHEHEMKLELINGSIWQPVGADNFNSLVGSNPVHVTYSEYALMNPQAREYLRPIIAENDGSELFISTARGYNHFYDLAQFAKDSPLWHYSLLTVDDTGVIPPEVLEEERKTMPEELFRQEFMCDFSAANVGAILGRWVEQAEKDGRVSDDVEYDPNGAGLVISSDIGRRDTATWWFWQPRADGFALVDYDEDSGLDADEWSDRLAERIGGRKCERIWLPHDAKAKTFSAKYSAIEIFLKRFGSEVMRIVPLTGKGDRINAGRKVMPHCWFAKTACAKGLAGLRAWSFEWNMETRQFSREPKHDWACFHPDTKVLTRYGTRRIMDLPQNGEVLTPCGWKTYQGPRITRRNAQLVEVTFKDGHTVKCTPDHLFLTDNGWKSAESLTMGTLIQSTLTRSRSISMAVYIGFGQVRNTLHGAVKNFTDAFGRVPLVRSLMDAIFTIKTPMQETIHFQIWSVSQQTNTSLVLGMTSTPIVVSPLQHVIEQQLGINQRRGYFGIGDKQKVIKNGSSGRVLINLVLNVKQFLKRSIGQGQIRKNSVQTFAGSLIIESVLPLQKRVDTCCIHVPDGECFSLANGAVVHNSHPGDGWSYGAQVLREHIVERAKDKPNHDVLADFGPNGARFQLPCLDTLWKETPAREARI